MAKKAIRDKPRINYILQINAFWDRVIKYPLNTSAIAVWFYLLHKNNKWDWIEFFFIDHELVKLNVGISKNTFYTCRNELEKFGYIKVQKSLNPSLNDKISLPILYQNLGIAVVPEEGIAVVPEQEQELEKDSEPNKESSGTLVKQVNSKHKTKNKKLESVNDDSPPAFLIFDYLTEHEISKTWTDKYRKDKSLYFTSWFKTNWDKVKQYGWQNKLNEFILTERNPELTPIKNIKPKQVTFIDYWDDRFYRELDYSLQGKFRAHLRTKNFVDYPLDTYLLKGTMITKEKAEELLAKSSVIQSSVGSEANRSPQNNNYKKSLIPETSFKNAVIPPNIKQ